ncbi:MAG: iron-sulfur cluster carrier protein ApbC [Alphaproteobacteria bacterium]
MTIEKSNILEVLENIIDPISGDNIVAGDMVKEIHIKGGNVQVVIEINPSTPADKRKAIESSAENLIRDIDGVKNVYVIMTAEKTNIAKGVKDVAHIIAVASGKGGVGKSTTTTNLAVAMRKIGLKVGVMDADVFGPSQPRMLGINDKPDVSNKDALPPLEGYGLKAMSIGFLVDEDKPVVWRGPMVMGAIKQMLEDVIWGELDVLIVDMPPGTGDAQLTLAQTVPLSGAVIVSTPQDIALIDARKGISMFEKVNVPILGIIENMSTFVCPNCNHESHIFSNGGAKEEAEKLEANFLGEIPLDIDIRKTSDEGKPIVATKPDNPQAIAYMDIAMKIIHELENQEDTAPTIQLN